MTPLVWCPECCCRVVTKDKLLCDPCQRTFDLKLEQLLKREAK